MEHARGVWSCGGAKDWILFTLGLFVCFEAVRLQEIFNYDHTDCLPLVSLDPDVQPEFHIDCYDSSLIPYDIKITKAIVGYASDGRCYHQPSDACVQNVTQMDVGSLCNQEAECTIPIQPESITACGGIQSNYLHVWYKCIQVPIPHGESATTCLSETGPSQLLISCEDFTVHSGSSNIYYTIQILQAFQGYDESQTRCFQDPADCSRAVTEDIRAMCAGKEVCNEQIYAQHLKQCNRWSSYIHVRYECLPYNNNINGVQETSSCTHQDLFSLPFPASFLHVTCNQKDRHRPHIIAVLQAWYGYTSDAQNACTHNPYDCRQNRLQQYQEQCSGQATCEISLDPVELTQCNGEYSSNFYIQYECIAEDGESFLNICDASTRFISDTGFIASPKYPAKYPSDTSCQCEMTTTNVDAGIRLQMVDFNMEHDSFCKFDWLEIVTSSDGYGIPQCGKSARVPNIQTTYFKIKMVSDTSFQEKGFLMKFSKYSISGQTSNNGEIKVRCRKTDHPLYVDDNPSTATTSSATQTTTQMYPTTNGLVITTSTNKLSSTTDSTEDHVTSSPLSVTTTQTAPQTTDQLTTTTNETTVAPEITTKTRTPTTTASSNSTKMADNFTNTALQNSTTSSRMAQQNTFTNMPSTVMATTTMASRSGEASGSTAAIGTDALIGIVVAVVVTIIIIVILAVIICRRKRRSKRRHSNHSTKNGSVPATSADTNGQSYGATTSHQRDIYKITSEHPGGRPHNHIYETIPYNVVTQNDTSKLKNGQPNKHGSPLRTKTANGKVSDKSQQQDIRKSDIYNNPAFEGNSYRRVSLNGDDTTQCSLGAIPKHEYDYIQLHRSDNRTVKPNLYLQMNGTASSPGRCFNNGTYMVPRK